MSKIVLTCHVKLMLIVLVTFILLMLFLGWVGDMPLPVTIPPESIALSAQVAKGLEGTNIPGYVLQYGMYTAFKYQTGVFLFASHSKFST